MEKNKGRGNLEKYILTVIFIAILCVVGVKNHPYALGGNLIDALKPQQEDAFAAAAGSAEQAPKAAEKIRTVKSNYNTALWGKPFWLNLNGSMLRKLGMQGYYGSMGMYITYNDYILSSSAKTSTDYEVEEMKSFKSFLDGKGINLLYVNAPTKYVDDNIFAENFGIESYSNRNADLFLQRIEDAGIDTVDLREELNKDGMNIYDMFYRTDHHWTTRSGLWATGKVARALNKYCGYQIPGDLYDESNYSFREFKDCWLGEQGRKVSETYVGLDDYTEIKPNFATDLTLRYGIEAATQGDFNILVNEGYYDMEKSVYENPSWHYSYMPRNVNGSVIHNNNVGTGKVLLLGDSYSQVIAPFLSLGVSDLYTIVPRGYNGSIREFIKANDIDTVVILYAQFMIGAHDNPASANYKMFTLE